MCDFSLCAAEKARTKVKTSKPKTAEKRKSRTLPHPLRASSLPEGAFVCACFFSVPQRSYLRVFRCFPNNPSGASHRPPLPQGSHRSVRFLALCRRENKDKIHGSKLKVRTFFFCGSAAFHHEPSSERKVSRTSVTKGACETEKRQKAAVFGV